MYNREGVFKSYNISEDISPVRFDNKVKEEFTVIILYYS